MHDDCYGYEFVPQPQVYTPLPPAIEIPELHKYSILEMINWRETAQEIGDMPFTVILRHRFGWAIGNKALYDYVPLDRMLNYCKMINPKIRTCDIVKHATKELTPIVYQLEIPLSYREVQGMRRFSEQFPTQIVYVKRNFLNNYLYPYLYLSNNEQCATVRFYFGIQEILNEIIWRGKLHGKGRARIPF